MLLATHKLLAQEARWARNVTDRTDFGEKITVYFNVL